MKTMEFRTYQTCFMIRRGICLCFIAGCLLSSSTVWATFSVESIVIYKEDNKTPLDDSIIDKYFNKAICDCNSSVYIEITLNDPTSQSTNSYLQIVTSPSGGCLDTSQHLNTDCIKIYSDSGKRIQELPARFQFAVPAKTLMGEDCTNLDRVARKIIVYTDTDGDGTWESAKELSYTVDTTPPDTPTSPGLTVGENKVTVTFKTLATSTSSTSSSSTSDAGTTTTSVVSDLKGYQILCAKVDSSDNESPVFDNPPDPEYQSALNICSATASSDAGTKLPDQGNNLPDISVDVPDIGINDLGVNDQTNTSQYAISSSSSSDDAHLAKQFVCSSLSSSGEISVSNLENGSKYRFWVVAIDNSYNPSSLLLVGDGTPVLVEDLWELYKKQGGQASSEKCFIATAAYGSYNHPQVRILREFRDAVLLPTRLGQWFVETYYRLSPRPARWLAHHDNIRPLAKAALWPITLGAAGWLYTSPMQKLLLVFGVGLMILFVWRRRNRRLISGKESN